MQALWQTAAVVLLTVILAQMLRAGGKVPPALLTMCVSAMVLIAAMQFLQPLAQFLAELEAMGKLGGDMLKILMKAVGITLITRVVELICSDSGHSALGSAIQIFSTFMILYLSIPLFRAFLDIVRKILEAA